jgi:Neutral/alkaline non-lysosomal ceramidase, N-terminal
MHWCVQPDLGSIYNETNVAISGIHTHSGPGGYLQYVLYDITSLGFVEQSWAAVVNGIAEVGCVRPPGSINSLQTPTFVR